jgi:signal transduction histidine kinase
MDSNAMSCADFGRLILLEKRQIIDAWRHQARAILGPSLRQPLLDDRIPVLVDLVAEALGATVPPIQPVEKEIALGMEHGTLRADQGIDITQVVREFHMLRKAIRDVCAKEGKPLTQEATSIIAEVIDTTAALGMGRLTERREETIRGDDARKMSFIVHDFRTPLGAIALAATEIIDSISPEADTPEMNEALAALGRNVERLSLAMEDAMKELVVSFSGMRNCELQKSGCTIRCRMSLSISRRPPTQKM